MASKNVFGSMGGIAGKIAALPEADTQNRAGGRAYSLGAKAGLAQYAATCCFNNTFYASASEQLDEIQKLLKGVEPKFVAKTAIFARERGFMKDMPAFLLADLTGRVSKYHKLITEAHETAKKAADEGEKQAAKTLAEELKKEEMALTTLIRKAAPRILDNGRMIRNFVQMIRSGKLGRKSLGTMPRSLVRQWLEAASASKLFRASVGNNPSLADVIKMTHPKPDTEWRKALYAYLISKPYEEKLLPDVVKDFERFKKEKTGEIPDVDFRMLTTLDLGEKEWTQIALKGGWQMVRMNLNTFERHGVLKDADVCKKLAAKLKDREEIARARVFPYQLMIAYTMTSGVPHVLKEALQDAMEAAVDNVPEIQGQVYIGLDVSGSMSNGSVTGERKGATSVVRPIDVASLIAAAVARKNRSAEIIPFAGQVVNIKHLSINPRDTVLTNAQKLGSIGGGSTNCSAVLEDLNKRQAKGDLVIYVSDNESWVDNARVHWGAFGMGYVDGPTSTMAEWEKFKARNPQARMICIDLCANATTQAKERPDIFNVGGFSDQVFSFIADVSKGLTGPDAWVAQIEALSL